MIVKIFFHNTLITSPWPWAYFGNGLNAAA